MHKAKDMRPGDLVSDSIGLMFILSVVEIVYPVTEIKYLRFHYIPLDPKDPTPGDFEIPWDKSEFGFGSYNFTVLSRITMTP